MQLGLHVAYWGLGLSSADQLRLIQEAERVGFSDVWVGEAYGSDAASVLGWLAAQTDRLILGSGVFQIPGRSAAMTAMTAATIDQISGGRFRLGLGTSGPQVSEGWHGVSFKRQLARTRDYVEILRRALARERLEHDGKTITLPIPDGPGKALKLTIAPEQDRIPIYIAALGPKNTALCGEIADGWLPVLFAPEHVGEVTPNLEEGARKAGRSLDDVAINPLVYTAIDEDPARARDAVREMMALYVGGMGPKDGNFYNRLVQTYGFEEAAERVQDLYLEGKKDEAAAALPDELLDTVCLIGTPDAVKDRLAAYADAGVSTLLVNPIAGTVDERIEQIGVLADAL